MKRKNNTTAASLWLYLFGTYALGMGFFLLFRLLNTVVFRLDAGPQHWGSGLLKAFAMGLRFDTVVSCYLLALPLLGLLIAGLCGIRHKAFYRILHLLTVLLYLTAFLACAADIPFFHYFFTRLNITAFDWMDSFGFVVRMVLQEPMFLLYLLLYGVMAAGYLWLMRRIRRRWLVVPSTSSTWGKRWLHGLVGLLLAGCCLIGMRGRLSIKSPIRTGTAYFSDNAFLNQLGLNPLFTLLSSYADSRKNREIELMDEAEAARYASAWLPGTPRQDSACIRLAPHTNVVIIIMESMAACKVGHFHPESRLTPHLDSLISGSRCYENAYSAGIHTHNGIYSTLFSYPAMPGRHSMKGTLIPEICALPHLLKEKGYQTLYFTTHDEQFDNVAGFLYANGIRRIVSQKDYPVKEVKSTLGVPDHVMFDRAITELSQQKTPFFACLMTASDHNPYILPKGIDFTPHAPDLAGKMVEYADWAIGRFIRKARQQPWFRQTLFVLVADHGASAETLYDMPLSYHHIPLLFYAPGQIPPAQCRDLALQADIGPTVTGMLFPGTPNHTFGIDLQRYCRPYAYFSADDKIGVIDSCRFYRYRMTDGDEGLYHYRQQDARNHIREEGEKAAEMRRYGFSMIQQASSLRKKGLTGCDATGGEGPIGR